MTLRKSATKPRQRWALLIGAVAALTLTVAAITLAVHDEEFQLDGDVIASTTTDIGDTTQLLDWDSLFDENGAEITPLPDGFEADDIGFEKDFENDGTDFITSDTTTFATGSKDTLPIADWQCNFDNNVNSKIDVMNAYAALYTDPDSGDEIVYFALERNTNTGDANVAFWFLQDEVGCTSTGGAVDFTGGHSDGDLLIVSAFSGGGTVSSVDVYEWVGDDATGALNTTPVFTGGVDCRDPLLAVGDSACGAANIEPITTPWLTADFKEGVGHDLRTAEFFEGGVNLTQEGLGGQCFNTFLANTRSSTTLTATLFDFAAGTLGSCESELMTDPSVEGSVEINAAASVSVTDDATLTIDGADEWSGTLSFFLCGPLAAEVTCETGGVPSGSIAVNQDTEQPITSDASTVTEVGRYCWRGFFDSATQGVPDATDATEGECFDVTPVTPTLTTQAGEDVTLGQDITDTATLTGTANQPGTNGGSNPGEPDNTYPSINATNGAPAGGTITWTVQGPDDCDASGLTVTGSPATVSGDDTYGPVSATPTAIGTYTFVATYSGSSPNTNGAGGACPPGEFDGDEEVAVTGEATLSTAQDWLPNDTATIEGPTALSGTATFTLFTGTTCGAGVDDTIVYGPVDVTVSGPSPQTPSTSNTTLVLEADSGGYSWLVSYDDDVLDDPDDTCETTTITIID